MGTRLSVLSFLTTELSQRVRTFNLNRLDEIRSHLTRAYRIFSNINIKDNSNRTIKVFQFETLPTPISPSETLSLSRKMDAQLVDICLPPLHK
eukprot:g82359.t1